MEVIRQLTVNAPATRLWEIVGEDYVNVGNWTSQIETSGPNPDLPPGQGRVCSTPGFGDIKETVTQFDEQRHVLSYAADVQKMPFFVKEMGNTWRIEPKGQNQSVVHMHMKGRLLPVFAQLMGPVMKGQMSKTVDIILEELKHYAETGQVHARVQA
ncbi:MAG: SRPBCC family protein [Chloroflexota bacterium]